jgi:hypothetical protein
VVPDRGNTLMRRIDEESGFLHDVVANIHTYEEAKNGQKKNSSVPLYGIKKRLSQDTNTYLLVN